MTEGEPRRRTLPGHAAVPVKCVRFTGADGRDVANALEAKARQIQFVDEHVDHAHRVVLDHKVVKTLGQQRNLGSALPFDESLHAAAPEKADASV